MSFEIKQEEKNGQKYFFFCGTIDEEAQFPEIDTGTNAVIDLTDVQAINSIGIRSWIMWFKNHQATHFQFLNCPKALVMQMNMVEGFLPDGAEVLSMMVPFYCEDCDEEKEILFEVGKNVIIQGDQVQLSYDKTNICGGDCEPELDVSEAKFFRFLLNGAKQAA